MQPLRLLLAEDNIINQKLMRRLLEKAGHEVTLARTGRAALDALGAVDVRHGADGRADAGDGRLRGDGRDPRRRAGAPARTSR